MANSSTRALEELIKEVPESLYPEVRAFIETVLSKQKREKGRALRQDWANALADYEFTSVDLQHLALQWRAQ